MRVIAFVIPFVLLGFDLAEQMAPTSTQLSTPAEFAPILGQRLKLNESDRLVLNADGSLLVEFGGAVTRGAWVVRDGFWCRELTDGPRGPSPKDCQIWTQEGGSINVTRDQGRGGSFFYEIS